MKKISHFINGQHFDGRSSRYADGFNPATGEICSSIPLASTEDVALAVAAAKAAFPAWSETPALKRARILFNFKALLDQHQDELAELITREHGKVFSDAKGEVMRGIEIVEFACGIPQLLKGQYSDQIGGGIDNWSMRQALGVVAGVTPFNFPMMVPCWMFPLAIACGNSFVLKASERTPLLAQRLVELFSEAGLPKGVLNLVHGAHDVVNGMLRHPEVKAVSFVGSQPVAEYVYREAASNGKRVQALAGAKNHSIVLADADLDITVKNIIAAAFGSAGERCMACAVVVVVDEIADRLVARLKQEADALIIGNGMDKGVFLGPVIRDEHRQRTLGYIDSGEREGATLLRDGRKDGACDGPGYFVGPTLFDHVTPQMKIWQEEIFAPVLSIVRVKDLGEAIRLTNQSEFANGACLYTDSAKAVRQFRDDIDAGMLGVNVGVPAPMAFFPFSGYKKSFYGDLHANGRDGVEFFTRKKMLTARY
jgi:malonate-semialdehyde dehydrogenase (acetylating)/methylmalonate-semialdehyde dehydrogenase